MRFWRKYSSIMRSSSFCRRREIPNTAATLSSLGNFPLTTMGRRLGFGMFGLLFEYTPAIQYAIHVFPDLATRVGTLLAAHQQLVVACVTMPHPRGHWPVPEHGRRARGRQPNGPPV